MVVPFHPPKSLYIPDLVPLSNAGKIFFYLLADKEKKTQIRVYTLHYSLKRQKTNDGFHALCNSGKNHPTEHQISEFLPCQTPHRNEQSLFCPPDTIQSGIGVYLYKRHFGRCATIPLSPPPKLPSYPCSPTSCTLP